MTAIIRKLEPKKTEQLMRIKRNSATKKNTMKIESFAFLKMGLVMICLSLVLVLSVISNFIFFEQLLVSSVIILGVTAIKFFEENIKIK